MNTETIKTPAEELNEQLACLIDMAWASLA
jgi:hypothetical protein